MLWNFQLRWQVQYGGSSVMRITGFGVAAKIRKRSSQVKSIDIYIKSTLLKVIVKLQVCYVPTQKNYCTYTQQAYFVECFTISVQKQTFSVRNKLKETVCTVKDSCNITLTLCTFRRKLLYFYKRCIFMSFLANSVKFQLRKFSV